MKKNIAEYFKIQKRLFDTVIVTGRYNRRHRLVDSIEKSISMIIDAADCGGKLFFIGNGASASISSHISTDFWKNAGIPAQAFNDSSLLTCVSNDYGYERVFEKPIEMFANPGDILFTISSSGQSKNIICATKKARAIGLKIITFSGFEKGNALRKLGDINFYVPNSEYGFVETIHQSLCHCLVDTIIKNKSGCRKV